MWKCSQCSEEVEDNFDVCWNCGTSEDGVIDPDFPAVIEEDEDDEDGQDAEELALDKTRSCMRCAVSLTYFGSTRLQMAGRPETFTANVLESTGIPSNQKWLEVYGCAQCGHAEFFLADKPPSGFL